MEVLDTETSVPRPAEPVTDLPLRGTLELDGVELTYPGADAPVLRDVTFRAEPGQTVAVIGSTGAGKSTLVNLVPRLFDVTGGELRVDGVDVRHLAPERLWSVIGLVPQRAYLFSGTVAVQPAARQAGRHRRGALVGAGDRAGRRLRARDARGARRPDRPGRHQRQRRSAPAARHRARGGRRSPEIYLFDDSFSALDLATDARLRAALRPVTRDATVLIVAQRVSTIRDADLILVLEDGVVVDRGTHEELLATSRDLPGDRRVPAERGGGGMTETAARRRSRASSRRPSGSPRAPAPAAARWAAAWSARRPAPSGRRPSGWSGRWRRRGPRRSPGRGARRRQRRADVDRAADPGPRDRPDLRRRPRQGTSLPASPRSRPSRHCGRRVTTGRPT